MSAVAPSSPYKGLSPFGDSELDALLFFGRERDQEIVVANLIASRLTVLYGPSGVGKSSLLQAGVARTLRELPERPLVVVFSSWGDDPAEALARELAHAAGVGAGTLLDTIRSAEALHGDVYLVLDQAEEYFLYHPEGSAFEDGLAAVLSEPLRANVLLSLREDALAKLDRFKGRIPNILGNYLRLDRLDRRAGQAAIVRPVERFHALGGAAVEVEPVLVDAVLGQVAAGRIQHGLGGQGEVDGGASGVRIEAPYLQLVMERLWDVERAEHSPRLRLATLERLGGSAQIVAEHLALALASLTPRQQDVAAALFNHLVTPSGAKIAHDVHDLAEYAAVDEAEALPVLESLAANRILRTVAEDRDVAAGYEIFHDVLAGVVLAWRTQHMAERALERERADARRRHRRLAIVAIVALVGLAAMAAVTVYALSQRSEAQQQAAAAQAAQQQADSQEALAKQEASKAKASEKVAVQAQNEAEQSAQTATAAESSAKAEAANATQAQATATAEAAKAKTAQIEAQRQAALAVAAKSDAQRRAREATSARQEANKQASRAKEEQQRAVAQKRSAESRELLATALSKLPTDPDTSLSKAVRAAAIEPSIGAEDVLRQALLASRVRDVLPGGGGPVAFAGFASGGTLVESRGGALADRRVVTVAGGGEIREFDARTAALLHTVPTAGDVNAAILSPDGRMLATAGRNGTVRLIAVAGPSVIRELLHGGSVTSVAFSPDGRLLVSTGTNQTAWIWDVATGSSLRRLVHPRAVQRASFSPDGERILTVSGDRLARLYDIATGRLLSTFEQRGAVLSAVFSPRGDRVVTTGRDAFPRLWDAATGELVRELPGHSGNVLVAAFSPSGDRLVTAGTDTTGRVWGSVTGELRTVLIGQSNAIVSASFSGDGRSIVTASRDGTARIWDAATGNPDLLLLGHGGAVIGATFSTDGSTALTASSDGTARLWNAQRDPLLRFVGLHQGGATAVAFSPDGRLVASGGVDGAVRVWHLEGGLVKTLEHGAAVTSVAFGPGDTTLLTAGVNGVARIWSLRDSSVTQEFGGSGGPIRSAAFDGSGSRVVTAGDDGTARIYETRSGREFRVLRHGAPVVSARFSPDGTLVAAASGNAAYLWRVGDGHAWQLRAHRDDVRSVSFSSDGTKLVTASRDHDVLIWDVATRRVVQTLSGHVATVAGAVFGGDGRWVVTAGPTKAGIWQVGSSPLRDGRLLFLRGNTKTLTGVDFSPDGRHIAVAGADGSIGLYDCVLCGNASRLAAVARTRLDRIAAERKR